MSEELPEGWEARPLPELAEINPRKPPADARPSGTVVSFVPMPAVDADRGAIEGATERPFGEVRKSYTAFADEDVLLAKITPCFENGKAAVARGLKNGLGFGSSEFFVLRSFGSVLPEYLFHYVRQQSFRDHGAARMNGAVGQARVPVDYLRETVLPVPPLAEQKRIVEKVEALFEDVNKARDRLAKVPLILKRFRQSVLAAACSGRLTEDWRARVGQGEPDRMVSDGDLPQGWTEATLGELAELVTSGSRGWARYYADDGPIFIRAQDINADLLDLSSIAHVRPPVGSEGARTRVVQNDLLITITGANVTKSARVEVNLEEAYVSQHVGLVRLHDPTLSAWTHLWLTSPAHGRAFLLDAAYGAGKPGLNLTNIKDVPLAIPSPAERSVAVGAVRRLMAVADQIELRVASATENARALPNALLAKAFGGDLVPSEAHLAEVEGRAYEPASELLARMAAGSASGKRGKGCSRTKAQPRD